MSVTKELTITLPADLAEKLQAMMSVDQAASESEVIGRVLDHGFIALADRERKWALEQLMRSEVVAACREMDEDPSSGFTMEEVRAHLDALHSEHTEG